MANTKHKQSFWLSFFNTPVCFLALVTGGIILTSSPTTAAPKGDSKVQVSPQSIELNEQGVKAAQTGDTAKAETFFRKALTADSHNLTAVYNLAGMYLQNQKNDPAIQLLSEYHKRIPTDAGISVRLGDAWFVKKNLSKAKEAYMAAFKTNPTIPGLPQKLATLALLQQDLTTAEKMLELAIKQQPRDFALLENLSSVYIATKKPDKAVATAQRALKAGAASPELYVTLGSAYESLGQLDNALSAYRRAAKLGSEEKELPDHIERLQKAVN